MCAVPIEGVLRMSMMIWPAKMPQHSTIWKVRRMPSLTTVTVFWMDSAAKIELCNYEIPIDANIYL